jgi:hypothetical protein
MKRRRNQQLDDDEDENNSATNTLDFKKESITEGTRE